MGKECVAVINSTGFAVKYVFAETHYSEAVLFQEAGEFGVVSVSLVTGIEGNLRIDEREAFLHQRFGRPAQDIEIEMFRIQLQEVYVFRLVQADNFIQRSQLNRFARWAGWFRHIDGTVQGVERRITLVMHQALAGFGAKRQVHATDALRSSNIGDQMGVGGTDRFERDDPGRLKAAEVIHDGRAYVCAHIEYQPYRPARCQA